MLIVLSQSDCCEGLPGRAPAGPWLRTKPADSIAASRSRPLCCSDLADCRCEGGAPTSRGQWRTCPALLHASANYRCISERASPGQGIYAGVLGGLESMVKSLAAELRPLRVNGVCASAVDTELWHRSPEAAGDIRAHRRPLAGRPRRNTGVYRQGLTVCDEDGTSARARPS